MTLIGRTVKPRDRCHSAYYRKSAMTSQIGRAVKCGMRKMQTMKLDMRCCSRTHIVNHLTNILGLRLSLLTLQKFLLIYTWQFYSCFNFQLYGGLIHQKPACRHVIILVQNRREAESHTEN